MRLAATSSHRVRWVFIPLLTAIALVTGVSSAVAHDFWVIPDAFQVTSGGSLTLRTITGTRFATSESPVPADRIAEARLLGATPDEDERLGAFVVSGKSLVIEHRPSGRGERVVALSLLPSSRRMSGEDFARYLRLEGAVDLVDRYTRDGRMPSDSIVMHSVKYAKTLVEIGAGGPRAFSRAAGHPLEFIPLSDPSSVRVGETLALRVMVGDRPVSGAQVHAGRASSGTVASDKELTLFADAAGIVYLPIARAGLWNVRTADAAPAAGNAGMPAAWDVRWATFVFSTAAGVEASSPSPTSFSTARSASDSASAVKAVAEFQSALSRGDSAAVLALLASDVVILESGDAETRAGYRSHHLAADIGYARAIPASHVLVSAHVDGNTAWVSSTSVAQGQLNGKAVNSAGAELMVLTRAGARSPWVIRAIHWSSRRK